MILTIDKKTGQLITSPDIISRGFIYMRDNEDLMKELSNELDEQSANASSELTLTASNKN